MKKLPFNFFKMSLIGRFKFEKQIFNFYLHFYYKYMELIVVINFFFYFTLVTKDLPERHVM